MTVAVLLHPACFPLLICGLLSDQDSVACAAILKQMQEDLAAKGCQMQCPFMKLAFITLIFIPMYGITDKGLVDVLQGKLVDPVNKMINRE